MVRKASDARIHMFMTINELHRYMDDLEAVGFRDKEYVTNGVPIHVDVPARDVKIISHNIEPMFKVNAYVKGFSNT